MATVTIEVPNDVYQQLRNAAHERGLPVEALALEAVENLPDASIPVQSWGARPVDPARVRAALDSMRKRRESMPRVSVVALIWEGRDELEARGILP